MTWSAVSSLLTFGAVVVLVLAIYVWRRRHGVTHRQRVETDHIQDTTAKEQAVDVLHAELRDTEISFRSLVESAPDAMVIVNVKGEVVLLNSQAEQLFGYRREEVLGHPIEALMPERSRERHRQHRTMFVADARLRTMGVGLELFGLHKDGHEIPVEIRLSPLITADGLIISSAIRDISSRKQEALRIQAFSSLAQRLNAVITPKDAARIMLEVADQLLGWDAAYLDTYADEQDELTSILNFDLVDGRRTEVLPTAMTQQPGPITRRVIADGGQLILRSAASEVVAQAPVFGDTTRLSESLIYVPIRHGTRVAGVLSIQSYIPNAYTLESLATLQALADHVGGALDRIRAQAALQQSESRQRYLVEHADDIIYQTDAGGHITSFNPIAVQMLGYPPEELRGRHYLELVHPDQRTRLARVFGRQFLKRIPSIYEEVLALVRDGTAIWLGQNVQLVLDGEQLVGFQVVARDVTRRRQAEQALTAANRKLTVSVTDLEHRNREISLLSHMGEQLQACQTPDEAYAVFSQSLAYLFASVSGALYMLNASRDQLEAVARWGDATEFMPTFAPDDCWGLRRGQPHGLEAGGPALRCRHLGEAPTAGALCVPMAAQSEVLGVLHMRAGLFGSGELSDEPARDLTVTRSLAITVTEQMALALSNLKLRETLRSQAIRDPLTGLFNRRYLSETLERELNRAARSQRPFGVIMLDLDHFKRFNDTFGHPAGDAVLREMGQFLKDHARGGDIACRYGGEEFTLVLPECPLEVTQRRAEVIRADAKQLAVRHHGQLLGALTVSLGVSSYPEHADTGEGLLQLADAALYLAKRQGRDRVVTATMP